MNRLLLGLFFMGSVLAFAQEKRTPLSKEAQHKFLEERTSGKMMGSFSGYCSLLYATKDVAIHTESEKINQTQLHSPFPASYKPTWAELFEAVARQTGSQYTYDAERDYWVFAAPAMDLPFKLKIADEWKSEVRGDYVFYGPPSAPVGMDIYLLGRYSFEEDEAENLMEIREELALRMATHFKKGVTLEEMS